MTPHPTCTVLATACFLATTACSCFVGATRVATPRGPRRIDALRVGDTVFSYDTDSGTRVTTTITAVHETTAVATASAVVGGRRIHGITGNHQVWDAGKQAWRAFADLRPGDRVLVLDDGAVVEAGIEAIALHEGAPVVVYDITVDGPHDFFADGMLAHNKDDDGDRYIEVGFVEPEEPLRAGVPAEIVAETRPASTAAKWEISISQSCEDETIEPIDGGSRVTCVYTPRSADGGLSVELTAYDEEGGWGSRFRVFDVLPAE